MKIELENIRKIYTKDLNYILALDNFNYTFESGKFYALTGHKGCGKSTLINILGLIEKVNAGRYTYNQKDILKLNHQQLFPIKSKIGYLYSYYSLDPYMNIYENVMLSIFMNKKLSFTKKKKMVVTMLKELGLISKIKHYPKDLSVNDQQYVALARALINDPELILADDPTVNLNLEQEEKIFKKLKELSLKGKCIIIATSSKNIYKYADIVLNLENGYLNE